MARLDNNLTALARHRPELHARLQSVAPDPNLKIEPSRRGPPTATATRNGNTVSLHSRFDPEREASRFIDGQDLKGAVVIIYGFGLGYHVEAALDVVHDITQVVVIDPDMARFRAVLEHRDLGRLVADKRLRLLIGTPPERIHEALKDLMVPIFLGTRVIIHEPSHQSSPEGIYRAVSAAVRDFIELGTTSLYTAASISAQSRFNTFMNMPHLLFNPGPARLRGLAQGCAGVVIGAGPSLQKNLHLLRGAPVVRIATGTILKKLIAEDLTPHFVCNIDYHFKLTKKYFQDLPPLPNTVLVMDPRANYGAADHYPGPVCAWDDPFLRSLVGDFWKEPHGDLPPAATVAQACFHLAQHLGCDPIMTIGMDLAYPDHITHMPGTAILDDWLPETNRFISMEDKEWEYIARTRDQLFQVPDLDGHPVYTDRQMFTYLQLFNELFREAPQRVINASEQGARKTGAETMTLAEALKQPFTPLPDDFNPAAGTGWKDFRRREEALEWVHGFERQAREVVGLYENLINGLEALEDLLDDPRAFNRAVQDMESIRHRLVPHRVLSEAVNELIQADDYQRQKDDLDITLSRLEGRDLKARQVQRDLNFTRGLLGGLRYLLEFILQARRRLEAWPQPDPEGLLAELEMIQDKVMREHG